MGYDNIFVLGSQIDRLHTCQEHVNLHSVRMFLKHIPGTFIIHKV